MHQGGRPAKRIYLSPPHMSGKELRFVKEVFASNWIAPVGPQIDAFEKEFAAYLGVRHAVALSSGTAALHLTFRALGLKRDEEVFCSTWTFAATANAICYEGGRPVFIDSHPETWNMDVNLLEEELIRRAKRGRLPRAVIVVDLYGQCADWQPIRRICRRFEIPLVEDAAEALGATYHGKPAGTFGWANVFSFNGNKIITTSGGGMLTTNDSRLACQIRFLSQQARDPAPHYEHSRIGFNYRMSNVLAGIGRGQLEVLNDRVRSRRRVFQFYRQALSGIDGLQFMPEASYGRSNRWLTCILVDPKRFGVTTEEIRRKLEEHNIETRPLWKPMHLQPVFSDCEVVGGRISEELFQKGLCLPSGSNLTEKDLKRVVGALMELRHLVKF